VASFNKFNSFVEALSEGVHNLGADTLTIALTNSAPAAANTVLANITEISYSNISSRVLTSVTSAQTGGTYTLDAADLVLTASGTVPTFRYVALYNDTATSDELIGYYDYGSAVDLLNGETFTITFDASGILTLA
jgi:hypothetical protein|tara:strand:+ start:13014 stop:13418 length:405 start_codon:yes stop_codon:yes gene_type:complete